MSRNSFRVCKALSEELDTEKLHRKFLASLLDLQNVERGSLWVKRADGYQCIEALGSQSDRIKGITIPLERPSVVGWVIENGKMTIAEPGLDKRHYKEAEDELDIKSRLILCLPLVLKSGEVYGAVEIIDTSAGGKRLNLKKKYLDLLQNVVDVGSIALSNSLVYSNQVKENQRLRHALDQYRVEENLIGRSPAFLKAKKIAMEYAKTDFPVLVTGESGTGKELFAREIHRLSRRSDRPFLVQNCSAIPDTLLESELFGYERGAFTGAARDKVGLFESADGGTVFLDEIGDMSFHLQARILRVVENNEVKPLGTARPRRVDVRIISATNKNLREEMRKKQFREDLFYRLNVLPLQLPSLRERVEDIPLLLEHFLLREAGRMGTAPKKLTREAIEFLIEYPWKGNVRELENFVKHILVIADGDRIRIEDLPVHFTRERGKREGRGFQRADGESTDGPVPAPGGPVSSPGRGPVDGVLPGNSPFEGCSWEEIERSYVLYLLEKHKWHITRAAKEAGIHRSTFDSRMKKLGIRK
ncbi:MAG: sigma-54-dependent Fis family transcriptional regulator [Syntrophobacteraceae bacterium]|nr:sigma-54-dependent Fis family transcriptional regulator [Syntrophobacteraceae bacterium]